MLLTRPYGNRAAASMLRCEMAFLLFLNWIKNRPHGLVGAGRESGPFFQFLAQHPDQPIPMGNQSRPTSTPLHKERKRQFAGLTGYDPGAIRTAAGRQDRGDGPPVAPCAYTSCRAPYVSAIAFDDIPTSPSASQSKTASCTTFRGIIRPAPCRGRLMLCPVFARWVPL